MEIPHTHKSGSKYLQPMLKKSSHNHNYDQTNPKPQPKPKTKTEKTTARENFHTKHLQQTTKTKNIVKSYSKPS